MRRCALIGPWSRSSRDRPAVFCPAGSRLLQQLVLGRNSLGVSARGTLTASMSAVAAPAASIVSGRFLGQHVAAGRVVLYDGVCNLCNWGVRWVAARDPDKRVMFCSVQSQAAEPYLRGMGLTRQQVLQRFVFVEYMNWSAGSTAALRVCRYLKQPWPLAQYLLLVPLPVRDAVYDAVAASRYRLFGRTPCCQVPDAALLDRFVDRDELVAGVCSTEGMEEEEDAAEEQREAERRRRRRKQQEEEEDQRRGGPPQKGAGGEESGSGGSGSARQGSGDRHHVVALGSDWAAVGASPPERWAAAEGEVQGAGAPLTQQRREELRLRFARALLWHPGALAARGWAAAPLRSARVGQDG